MSLLALITAALLARSTSFGVHVVYFPRLCDEVSYTFIISVFGRLRLRDVVRQSFCVLTTATVVSLRLNNKQILQL